MLKLKIFNLPFKLPKLIFTVLGDGKFTRFHFKYLYTIWNLAWYRNLARYRRTHLGSLWIGFTNLLQVSVFALVYGVVFKVPSSANKKNLKTNIEKIFKVNDTKINIINKQSRIKLTRGRKVKVSGFKKAIITLKKGQSIDLTTGI